VAISDPGGRPRSTRPLTTPIATSLNASVAAQDASASHRRRQTIATVTAALTGQSTGVLNAVLSTFDTRTSPDQRAPAIHRYNVSSTRCTAGRVPDTPTKTVTRTPAPTSNTPTTKTRRRSPRSEVRSTITVRRSHTLQGGIGLALDRLRVSPSHDMKATLWHRCRAVATMYGVDSPEGTQPMDCQAAGQRPTPMVPTIPSPRSAANPTTEAPIV
jgi:hypothetical protein